MWRALQKQNRGAKPRKQSTAFQGANLQSKGAIFAHPNQGAKLSPRCENFARTSTVYPAPAEKPLESSTATSLHFGHGKDQRRPFRLPILTDTSTHQPPWERSFATCSGPAIPPSEGEPLLSADTPPGGHPRPVPPATSQSLLGPLRREPSSRVLESHPSHLRQSHLQRNLGFLWGLLPTVIRRPMIVGPPIEGNWIAEIDPSTPRPTLI
ncbi:hypothetical protein CK203_054248 [Vitis vinifera]|uniref:Uncharacterized protein n=1 Tax=Vitis vinifera TaxID=29760 RepID=A0A438GY87_VITVI|nr:hypothetical protein CK203_054248 [Vitis vinifera]